MKIKFLGIVTTKDGKTSLCLHNRVAFNKRLSELSGNEIELTLDKKKKKRSNNQNSYYWGVVLEILYKHTDIGYTAEEWHEALKFKFLRKESKEIITVESTTELSTIKMENYLAKIRSWASDFLGCFIPLPNEEIDGIGVDYE